MASSVGTASTPLQPDELALTLATAPADTLSSQATRVPMSVSIPQEMNPMSSVSLAAKNRISAETLSMLSFATPDPGAGDFLNQENVLDRPPATPDKRGENSGGTGSESGAVPIDSPQLDPAPNESSEPAAAEKPSESPEPPKVTEEKARSQVLSMFGGESTYRSSESDMAHAYAAARKALRSQGIRMANVKMLAVIDFTLPSFDRRLALYNPRTGEESRHLVAHGHHSGELYVRSYSNIPGSLQSSPGLYRIGRHYNGEHGRAIRLHGLQKDINNLAHKRDVVLHAAWYVSYKTILENQIELGVPRIGRSHGCPAVSAEDLPQVLSKLQPGSYLFIYPVPAYVPTPLPKPAITPSIDGLLR